MTEYGTCAQEIKLIEVKFPALWRDGRFYRLDGVTEVKCPVYIINFMKRDLDHIKSGMFDPHMDHFQGIILSKPEIFILQEYIK